MKRTLISAAALLFTAGLAHAQSSVTIYGVVDMGITKGNGGTAANNGANGANKAWIVKNATASRLGFRGNEDMGGGLSAQFNIEHRFTPDDGVASSPFWNGKTFVQLTSKTLGRIYLGRDYSPAYAVANKSDPFRFDGVGSAGSVMWAGYSSPQNIPGDERISGQRVSNTVGYGTPNWGGFTAVVAVAPGEGVVGRDMGGNVEYTAGRIYAAVGHERMSGRGSLAASGGANGNWLWNAALHVDLGVVKPILYYARSETNAGTATPLENSYFLIGAVANIGPGRLKAAYGRSNPAGANNTATKIGLGYNYPLSKRTNLYFDSGFGRADARTRNNAYAVGVRHNF